MVQPLLQLKNITKKFRVGGQLFTAVNDVSFTIFPGESVAIVGESGSGKSTTARIAVGLETPTSGTIQLQGFDPRTSPQEFRQQVTNNMSMVFQDPYNSLNPRMSIKRNVEEPLLIHKTGNSAARETKVAELFDAVGLHHSMADKRPRNLSGGQRQRVAIARALALNPELIILDEPVSALDVSIQAQVLNLLADLRTGRKLSYLFISHDLAVVRHVADRTLVMLRGQLVEYGPTLSVLHTPKHPYTKSLIAAAMDLDSGKTYGGNSAKTLDKKITSNSQVQGEHWVSDVEYEKEQTQIF